MLTIKTKDIQIPTRPRVDFAGYHHVINRGVNRCDVFNNSNDKEMFLQIINKTATIHKVTLHDYSLMDNHYHLLIETQKENLSTFMRIVSANYSQYFNKKYKRNGHLWQDRYNAYIGVSGHCCRFSSDSLRRDIFCNNILA